MLVYKKHFLQILEVSRKTKKRVLFRIEAPNFALKINKEATIVSQKSEQTFFK